MEWKSQWHAYNRMYYNPEVNYVPWPRVVKLSQDVATSGNQWESRLYANADTTAPRMHPLDDRRTLRLADTFAVVGGGDDIIIDDYYASGSRGFWMCGNFYYKQNDGGNEGDYRDMYGPRGNCSAGPWARWVPELNSDGEYEVYVTYQGESGDSYSNVCYTVYYDGGSEEHCGFDHNIDIEPPEWRYLGTYDFTCAE